MGAHPPWSTVPARTSTPASLAAVAIQNCEIIYKLRGVDSFGFSTGGLRLVIKKPDLEPWTGAEGNNLRVDKDFEFTPVEIEEEKKEQVALTAADIKLKQVN